MTNRKDDETIKRVPAYMDAPPPIRIQPWPLLDKRDNYKLHDNGASSMMLVGGVTYAVVMTAASAGAIMGAWVMSPHQAVAFSVTVAVGAIALTAIVATIRMTVNAEDQHNED